ncbi:substrate-binding domain-containing protein [Methylothermus subterraneus]
MLGWLAGPAAPADTLRIYSDLPLAATVSAWIADFRAAHPDTEVAFAATNTLTAVQALRNGAADAIVIGRTLTPDEARAFPTPPLALPVGLDALSIVVHPDDARQEIGLAELEYLYAGTHRCQTGPPAALPRGTLYSPTPANASHFHFQAKVLCGGPLRPEVVLLPDDAAVIEQVARQAGALGFASQALMNPKVRPLPLTLPATRSKILPSAAFLASGRYPLAYYLYLYLAHPHPPALAFARTALSPQGQAILAKRFAPLPESIRRQALSRLRD